MVMMEMMEVEEDNEGEDIGGGEEIEVEMGECGWREQFDEL